jgi:hypothetical protein
MTSSACSITRASTQPPMVTDPRTVPPLPTSMVAPAFFGVTPFAATSVASAAGRPEAIARAT